MADLNIDNLTIEVTRKCNMNCEHCLRGNAQRLTISDQHIYKILQLIDNVHTLNISGGEPTLAMDALTQIKHCAIYGKADIGNFYMVTNGKAINVSELAEWINYMKYACQDNGLSAVAFSFDMFHTQTFNGKQLAKHQRNYHKLQHVLANEWGIFDEGGGDFIFKHSDKNLGYHNLLQEGRAKDFGTQKTSVKQLTESTYSDETIDFAGNLYLSANGMIVVGCDWSYDSIDNRQDIRVAHIDDITCQTDLIDALRAYNVKHTKRELQSA